MCWGGEEEKMRGFFREDLGPPLISTVLQREWPRPTRSRSRSRRRGKQQQGHDVLSSWNESWEMWRSSGRTAATTLVMLQLLVLVVVAMVMGGARAEVYIVLMEGDAVAHYKGGVLGLAATAHFFSKQGRSEYHRSEQNKDAVLAYKAHLSLQHDKILQTTFPNKSYNKLYSYHYLINGFAVQMSTEQAQVLERALGVMRVEMNWKVSKRTTYTPDFLGLPNGIWSQEGGITNAGEDVVIGMIDTGIDPTHPSFSSVGSKPYGTVSHYTGICEVAPEFPQGSCNGKIIGAQHFAAAAIAEGAFNASVQFASPLDGDGHGCHTSATAAGNYGVPVVVNGYIYGNASGMAPRARIAVYKALYRFIGGYIADVVAAVDQAVADGVDILSLSLGPNTPSGYSNVTFLNVFDVALLSAVKSDVLVVQAVGNGGPNPKTVLSFSPWILSVAAGVDDRSYPHYITLANNMSFSGMGLAPSTPGEGFQTLVWADDAALGLTNPLSSPSDCQDPSILDGSLLQGKILICTYSFDFAFGSASLQQVVGTVQTLGAVGFIMVVQSDLGPNKLDPTPFVVPAIVLTSLQDSQSLMNYYNNFTSRDSSGNVLKYGAAARINSGQVAQYSGQCQQVALFSSRGPDVEDSSYDEADVLKPNVMVPGYQIWAAWTPIGIDEPGFQGENFAMISGTSMATPHAAGIAALLIEAHPDWSPAALASAMMTTANTVDHQGLPLQAQQLSGLGTLFLNAATPFDFGSGAVNPTAALDPGLIFDAGHDDYIKFLCSVQGVSALAVYNTTGGICSEALPGAKPTDLNLPSITIAALLGTRIVPRMVTNVGSESEMYELTWTNPGNVSLSIVPLTFTVDPMQSQNLTFTLSATYTTDITTFGEVLLTGSLGHVVHIPISVMNKTVGV